MSEQRISAQEAGYLELPGAVKDSDCQVVSVDGGVSSERGCCNSFGWKSPDVEYFRCGECKYLSDSDREEQGDDYGENKPLGKKEADKLSFEQILNSDRPVKESKGKQ